MDRVFCMFVNHSRIQGKGDARLYALSGVWVHLNIFLPLLQRRKIFITFCLLLWRTKSSKNGVFS